MLPGLGGIPGTASPPSGSVPATVTYGARAGQATTSFSSSLGISTASSDRYVVVAVTAVDNSATWVTGDWGACTVGGQSCTRVAIQLSPSVQVGTAIYITDAPVTSGTSATVTLSVSKADHISCATYAVYGIASLADTLEASAAQDPTGTIDVPANGAMIAVAGQDYFTGGCSWTGVTEDFEVNTSVSVFNYYHTGGSYTTPTLVSGRTVTANFVGGSDGCLSAAAWGPV